MFFDKNNKIDNQKIYFTNILGDNMDIKTDENIDLREVLNLAVKKHAGQLRDDGKPYVTHPIRVATLVAKYKKSKNYKLLISASLLHDTLEDTYTSVRELYDIFGENSQVPSLIVELTTAKFVPKLIGKAEYLAHKMENMTSYALVIKLCDRLDNINDIRGCSTEKQHRTLSDTRYIINYLTNKRELTKTHKKIIASIEKVLKDYGY